MNFKEVTMGDGNIELIDVDTPPKLIRRGVLSMKQVEKGKEVLKPIYVIEHAEELGGADIVAVYRVKENSKPVVKDFQSVETRFKYRESTFLGGLANKKLEAQKEVPVKRKVENKPPLFLAPITLGVGTFTGKLERGFYEREQDRFVLDNGKPKIQYGENTGVFIGLDSVKWDKAFVNAGDSINQYVQDKLIWFDLQNAGKHPFKSDSENVLGEV